jgi:hypothetical protein
LHGSEPRAMYCTAQKRRTTTRGETTTYKVPAGALTLARICETCVACTIPIQGDVLHYLHKNGGRLAEETAVPMVLLPLLEGVANLHANGIIHRDIKPENILLTHAGQVGGGVCACVRAWVGGGRDIQG